MGIALVFGAFGLIIGSFLNVLILRWGIRAITGRSSCSSCGRVLAWYELIPLLSWFLLYGRCRTCKARISLQYPLVEGGIAALFMLIGVAPLPILSILLAFPIVSLLVAIAVYDLRHTLIPDAWVYTLAVLSLLSQFLLAPYEELNIPYVVLAGPLVALPLFALWFFSRGTWMGFGDVKLALAIGWLLLFSDGLLALFFAFSIGGLVGSVLLFFSSPAWRVLRKRFTPSQWSQREALAYTMKSEVPFGPFLVIATLIVWISHMHGISIGLDNLLSSLAE